MSAHNRRPAGKPRRESGARPTEAALIYGAHAVREALTAGKRKLVALYATANAIARIEDAAKAAGLKPQLVEARELTRRLGEEAVHQGLLLEAGPLPERDLSDVAATGGLILLLDQITDPHNVGAILRTAAAFAVEAIVVTERHSPQFSGVLAKAASGGLEHVEIVSVVNLARAMEELSRSQLHDSRPRLGRRGHAGDGPAASARGAGARRRRQGPAPPDARTLRGGGPPRYAGRDQEPERLQRLRGGAERDKAKAGLKRKKAPPAQGPAGRTQNAKPKLPHRALQPGRNAVAQKIERRGADAAE